MAESPPHQHHQPPIIASSSSTNMPTNTYALLLPSLTLFDTYPLTSLRNFYSTFGEIVVWAPIKAMGRVVIVWDKEVDGRKARRVAGQWEIDTTRNHKVDMNGGSVGSGHKRTRSRGSLLIRLLPLPPTSEADLVQFRAQPPSTSSPSSLPHINPSSYLVPPGQVRNFLISPPGSPPEGWEPITYEDAPNKDTLADDLMAALKDLEMNGLARRRGRMGQGRRQRKSTTESRDDNDSDVDGQFSDGGEEDEEDGDEDSAEVILQTNTGTVFQVQAPAPPAEAIDESNPTIAFGDDDGDDDDRVREYVTTSTGDRFAHHAAARMPFAAFQMDGVDSAVSQGGVDEGDAADAPSEAGWRTPGVGERTFSGRPVPTARPPLPPQAQGVDQ